MTDDSRDLERWIPRLLAVWRKARGKEGGPSHTLTPSELKEVAQGVRQLSLGLTRERKLAGARYMDDTKLLGAYLLFYWPVSYAQARKVLGELSRPRTALDLGSGPGPMAFASMDAGAVDVTCADRSQPALNLAKALATEAEEALATRIWDPQKSNVVPQGSFDLITLGHVLNELYGKSDAAITQRTELVEKLLSQLKPQGTLLIIEPALKDTSRDLLKLRDALVGKGYTLKAPCLFQGNCPALVKDTDWCHADRDWRMPALVEALAKAAGLHKESLKMSYLAVSSKGQAWPALPQGRLFRIVSEPLEGKGRQRYMGCGPEGRIGLALQEKHRTSENEAFFQLNRGDIIAVGETQDKGDGLAMTGESKVQVGVPAGKALIS